MINTRLASRLVSLAAAAFCLGSLVVWNLRAQEQDREPPPRDPGFRGPGPFGLRGGRFGMRGPGGGQGAPEVMLLGIPEVQTELEITEKQRGPVDEWMAESRDQMRSLFDSNRDIQDLSDEERETRLADMRKKLDESNQQAMKKLGRLLNSTQLERLAQLKLQREGLIAIRRPELAGKLELTDDQLRQLRELPQEDFFPQAPAEARDKARDEALAILTESQRKQWSELTGKEFTFPEPEFGPGGFGRGGRGGPGGSGGPGRERKIVDQFDKDKDGRLDKTERTAAREFLKQDRPRGRGGFAGFGGLGGRPDGPGEDRPGGPGFGGPPRGPGGRPGGPGREHEAAKPGAKISPKDVKPVENASFYDPNVLRTVFLQFDDEDWEAELADFNNTDVEVPATVTVDGQSYSNVGVHFRGMSSFMMVPAGSKRSLNLSFDFVDSKQRLYGYKTLNLLNAHEDPTFLHSVLYSEIARKYIPAPKANFVKVAINGENWGVYVNAQQFNKDFLGENYPSTKGTRWKVQGSPMGRGGLEYLGDDVEQYKSRYQLKTDDGDKVWQALIKLCKTLNTAPLDQLEAELAPMLDIDETLWFLALDNALINGDGYWVRASDYAIFRDEKGVFHMVPHDMNEAFQPPMGPGGPGGFAFGGGPGGRDAERPGDEPRGPDRPRGFGRGGFGPRDGGPRNEGAPGRDARGAGPGAGRSNAGRPGAGRPGAGRAGGGVELDPLIGLNDSTKPLRSRLLAVPTLKTKYLKHVRTIAEDSLDWNKLGPVVAKYEKLISKELAADTKKLTSFAAFEQTVSSSGTPKAEGRRPQLSLKQFADQRRAYLLNYPEIKNLPRDTARK